jgi:formylglycine-generating enzyme required for sulfatase activity
LYNAIRPAQREARDRPSNENGFRCALSATETIETATPAAGANTLPAETTDDKNVQMVLVPEGTFAMGSDSGQANEQPVHQVYLDAYYIDKYEVTNALYKECVEAGICDRPTNTTKYNSSQYAQHPVTWVYWDMAKEYCEWRGARLPTEAEWEKAARGTDERAYPWEGGLSKSFANYGNNVGDTTAVGSYPQGVSPYGAYDMAGNVEEWVSDWYGENYYAISPRSNPTGPESGDYHLLRGGSWKFDHNVSTTSRNMFLRQYPENYYFGVRCALSAHLTMPNSEFTATQLTPPSQTVTAPLTPTSQFLACDQKSTKMEYVADVTIPDGTEMNPGQVFLKTWKIRNAGSCSWDEGYKLIYQFGDEMLGKSSPLLGVVMPGQEVDVSVQFTAPMTKGEYTSL